MSEEDDTLHCGVCFEEYDEKNHIPKILNCFHSICHPCLQAIIDQNLPNRFPCPVCRHLHNAESRGAVDFQQNKYILTCIKMKSSKLEDIVPEMTYPHCTEHDAEMTLFCEKQTCNHLICPECQPAEHADHTVVKVEEKQQQCDLALDESINFIGQKIRELHDKETQLNQQYEVQLGKVEDARKIIMEYVNQAFDGQKQELLTHKEENVELISDHINEFEKKSQTAMIIKGDRYAVNRMDKRSSYTELIASIKQDVPMMMEKINNMKSYEYFNNQSRSWKDEIKRLSLGVVPVIIQNEDDTQDHRENPFNFKAGNVFYRTCRLMFCDDSNSTATFIPRIHF